MTRKWITPVIYTLIALAVFYVAVQLLTDTTSFLSSIIMMIGFAVLLYGAIYFFFLRHRMGSGGNKNEMKKYKQAVKQSKQKYKAPSPVKASKVKTNPSFKTASIQKKKSRRKNTPNLRVIEGSKNTKKDRASF
ncbi:SA1362 family protein [Halobacillus campisalis]|uniref:SA1362 family protein n=1 Tax=Halobacillus campisalis TaxID=435909 RepID=A0ABW2K408_9BACI|nr:SA1362 family protein [Halobacillus campisalis]